MMSDDPDLVEGKFKAVKDDDEEEDEAPKEEDEEDIQGILDNWDGA